MTIVSVHGDEIDDSILDLKYGQADVRASAAVTLSNAKDLRAVDPLIAALKDVDSEYDHLLR